MSTIQIEKTKTSSLEQEYNAINVSLELQEEGGYTITISQIPDLITEGETVDECVDNLLDTMRELYKSYRIDKEIPPFSFENILFEIIID